MIVLTYRSSAIAIVAVGLTLAAFLPLVARADDISLPPPDNWHARPPVHARNYATVAPNGYTPAQIRHAYGVDSLTVDGAGQVIGLVDAYDDPAAAGDLQTFIRAFDLRSMNGLPGMPSCTVATGPHPCFQRVAGGNTTPASTGWVLETSVDTQWAHAIAPGADVLLVEAKDDNFSPLFKAVDAAVDLGAQVVSMSWGGPEFAKEAHFDRRFQRDGVTFTASSGDSGSGVNYPAASPYVLAVGGTTLPLDDHGNLTALETAWGGSGGGISAYESEPAYQSRYPIPDTGGRRGVPDVAYDADTSTGVAVYGSTLNQGQPAWFQTGGTSISAPQWAGLIALANQGRAAGTLSSDDLSDMFAYDAATGPAYTANYRDIASGTNGPCGAMCNAAVGYDFVTGLGSPLASVLVPRLGAR